jgi:hypothetical protein
MPWRSAKHPRSELRGRGGCRGGAVKHVPPRRPGISAAMASKDTRNGRMRRGCVVTWPDLPFRRAAKVLAWCAIWIEGSARLTGRMSVSLARRRSGSFRPLEPKRGGSRLGHCGGTDMAPTSGSEIIGVGALRIAKYGSSIAWGGAISRAGNQRERILVIDNMDQSW